jgi:hypothetical protein
MTEESFKGFMRISKKYSFAMISILLQISILFIIYKFQFPEKLSIWATVSTQVMILVTTITFLTGQAKIDIQAVYGRSSPQGFGNQGFVQPFRGQGLMNNLPSGIAETAGEQLSKFIPGMGGAPKT